MINKWIKTISILLIVGLFFSACKGMIEDMNNDPNNFTDVEVELLLNQAMLNTASIGEAEPARFAALFTDQLSGCSRHFCSYDVYNVTSNNFDAIWGDLYQRGIAQAQLAKSKAEAEGSIVFKGIAQILEAYYFGEAAALFGDIPFSEVNNVNKYPDPSYEDQLAVLQEVQALLDEGIQNAGGYGVSTDNVIFESTATWSEVAYALKARYYLLVKNYEAAKVAAAKANFISPEKSLDIIHTTTNKSENLFWQFMVEQRGGYFCIANAYMWQLLKNTEAAFRGNSKTDEALRFNYYFANDIEPNTSEDGFFAAGHNFPIISYEEIQLILAEATLRENAANAGDALAILNAVRSNWNEFFGASMYSDYELADFDSGGIANLEEENRGAALLREILEEKYLSVIGLPTYHDINRTQNMLGVPIKSPNTTIIPQRFLYPSTESSSNANFPGLVGLYQPTKANE